MSVFRRRTSSDSQSKVGRSSATTFTRLARVVGRLLLWGCVLLLLIRGALSVLGADPGVVTKTHGVTVTVTQPAFAETSQARRK